MNFYKQLKAQRSAPMPGESTQSYRAYQEWIAASRGLEEAKEKFRKAKERSEKAWYKWQHSFNASSLN